MVDINTRPMQLAEFEALLDRDDRRLELWPDGTVHEKPPVTSPHALIESALGALLEGPQRARGRAFAELNVAWGERPSYRPDVAFYARERLSLIRQDDVWVLHPRAAPDLTVEVRSPDQTHAEQLAKCQWYVTHGVPLAWLIDVIEHVVYVIRAGQSNVEMYEATDAEHTLGLADLRATDIFALLEP